MRNYFNAGSLCDSDRILIHIPSKTAKRFHGTFYDDLYIQALCEWVKQFSTHNVKVSADVLLYYIQEDVDELFPDGISE